MNRIMRDQALPAADGFDESNPYLPPQVQAHAVDVGLRKAGAGYPILLLLCMATIGIGVVLSVVDVETIVGSGPVLSVLCLVALVVAIRKSYFWGGMFGVSGIVITLTCFALISMLRWSPKDAEIPIPVILAGYSMLAIPCGFFAVREHATRNKQEKSFSDGCSTAVSNQRL